MTSTAKAPISETRSAGATLRVLHVIPGDPDNPTCMAFIKRQVADLQRYGIELESFYVRSRTSPRVLLQEYRRLRAHIRAFDPQIVHAHYGTVTALLCAVATSRPLVISYRGSDLNPCPGTSRLRSLVARTMSQLAAVRAKHVLFVSERLRKRLWWPFVGSSIVPTGVDLNFFRPLPQAEARRLLGWNHNDPVVLFNARTDPKGKRLDLAEGAVAHVRQTMPNVRLEVLRGGVHPDQMPWHYSASDCLLMMSDFEGSPNVVKESLACNLPVIGVDVGDVPERLAGVTHSCIVERDPTKIGAALAEVLKTRQRSNGRTVVEICSHQRIAAKIAEIYEAAAGRKLTVNEQTRAAA